MLASTDPACFEPFKWHLHPSSDLCKLLHVVRTVIDITYPGCVDRSHDALIQGKPTGFVVERRCRESGERIPVSKHSISLMANLRDERAWTMCMQQAGSYVLMLNHNVFIRVATLTGEAYGKNKLVALDRLRRAALGYDRCMC